MKIFPTSVVCLALAVLGTGPLDAQGFCQPTLRTPALVVPEFGPGNVRMWGALEPTEPTGLPSTRDSTDRITGFEFPDSTAPAFRDADYAGGFLFATAPYGFNLFAARTDAEKRAPFYLADRDGYRGDFLAWNVGGEVNRPFLAGDAFVEGNFVYHVGVGQKGMIVHRVDPAQPAEDPVLVYQDWKIFGLHELEDVEVMQVNGRNYAYVSGLGANGVSVYDMTTAASLNGCLDDVGSGNTSCGVFRGSFNGGGQSSSRIHVGADGGLVVYASFDGVQLFDASNNPTNPAFLGTVDSGFMFAGEVFQNNAGQFGVATQRSNTVRIFDVTNCVNSFRGGGTCNIPSSAVETFPGNNAANIVALDVGGRNLLYTLTQGTCPPVTGDQYLFDVSDLSTVTDLMPRSVDTFTNDGFTHQASYSSYSMWGYPATGGRAVQGWSVGSADNYIYRAFTSILDVHELVDLEPVTTVTGPAEAYAGDPTVYTASAANCPNFQNGTWTWMPNPDSTAGNTATFTFSTLGPESISVSNSECPGANEIPLDITVLDPNPAIDTFRINGQAVGVGTTYEDEMCALLTFSLDASGQPPLSYSWQIVDQQQNQVASSSAPTFPWDTSDLQTTTGAIFEAMVDLSNSSGSASTSRMIDLEDLPPLGYGQAGGHPVCGASASACASQDPPGTGNVSLYANSVGANAWKWEYREQGSSGAWTLIADFGAGLEEDSVTLTLGDWEVRSTIRNCIDETTESIFDVVVDEDDPVTAIFDPAGCQFGCEFPAPRTQTFADFSTGPISTYEYDFLHQGSTLGTCNFGTPQSQPQMTFTYTTAGNYRPCLRVTGPSNSDIALTTTTIIITAGNPPSVSVNCPSSTTVGTNVSCVATAQNCSPAGSGWSWSTTGGSIAGSGNGPSVSVSWSTPGSKVVQATNSSCGSASGLDTVSVTDGGGGGTLNAAFTFSPAEPEVSQQVSLNAASSTGNIVAYSWTVDPPGAGGNQTLNGITASFTPSVAGDYRVSLDVFSQPGCANPTCQDSQTQTITVGGREPVTASFTVTPASPVVGQTTTINTGASTGPIVDRLIEVTAPGGGTTSYSGARTQTHVFTQPGTHTVELTVTNEAGCSDPDCMDTATQTVNVGAAVAPTAAFTFSPSQPVIGESLQLDSTSSTGPIVARSFRIQQPNGAVVNASGSIVDITPIQVGVHQVTLEVETAAGCATAACQDTITQSIDVLAFAPLVARYMVNPDPPRIGEIAVFSASTSGGNPTSYSWNIGGLTLTGESVAVQLADMGDLDIELTIARGSNTDTLSETIRVFGPCVPGPETLCMAEGRFRGSVTWETAEGETGVGTVRPERTDNSGMLWFFNPDNVEQLVKVLDGCSITGHFWVLAAALTNVGYELTIEDLIADEAFVIENEIGIASPATVNTGAFETCSQSAASPEVLAQSGRAATDQEVATLQADAFLRSLQTVQSTGGAIGTCLDAPTQACFIEGRFRAEISFATLDGQTGLARVGVLDSENTGVFYFFDPDNLEIVAKVIDGCGVNERFWVFAAATTDQQYTLRITDTVSGQSREYFNELGTVSAAVTDIDAFDTCPAGQ